MKRIFRVAIIGFSFLIMGCTVKISDVAVKPTPQYKFCQEKGGLKIAIDPFFEKERLKEYFGADLVSHGILPLLIIVENHHLKAGYLLDKKFFSAALETVKEPETKEGTDPSVSVPKEADVAKWAGLATAEVGVVGPAVGAAAGVIVAPGPGLVLIPITLSLAIYATKIEGDILKINDNLSKKAFVDRTVFPGESHSGFIYFQLKNREGLQNISAIMIKAKQIPSEKELDFIFQINK